MKKGIIKFMAALTAMSITAGMVTGCSMSSLNSDSGNSTHPATTTAKPANVQLFHYMNEQFKRDALDVMLKRVTEKNHNITFEVSAITFAQYQSLLHMKIASGDIPDIMTARPQNQREQVKAGVFLNLTNEPFMRNVVQMALDEGKVEEKYWALPMDFTAFGILYNKKMFEKYNLKAPTTLTEMLNVCETFKKNGVVPFVHGYKDVSLPSNELGSFLTTMAFLKDKSLYLDAQTKKRKWSEIHTFRQGIEIFNKYLDYTDPGDLNFDAVQALSTFASEKRPMMITGLWTIGDIRAANPNGDFDVFAPVWSEKPEENLLNLAVDDAFAISASSKVKEAALTTLSFMASEEGTKIWSSKTNLLSTSALIKDNSSTEQVLKTVFDAYSKGKVIYRKDIVQLSGEALQKYRLMLQWMVFLKSEERTVDKLLQYFDKEYSTIK
jgi:ABC-type glycerol-3-phosphate transport system substrate-binding protein